MLVSKEKLEKGENKRFLLQVLFFGSFSDFFWFQLYPYWGIFFIICKHQLNINNMVINNKVQNYNMNLICFSTLLPKSTSMSFTEKHTALEV